MLISILFGLTSLSGVAHAGDAVLRPAYCKTEKDYREAHSRQDPHAWDMYTVGSRAISLDGSRVVGSAIFSFYQCSQKPDGSYGWKLYNEGRSFSDVYLLGQGEIWGGVKHINVSSAGRIDVKSGQGAAALNYTDLMDADQKYAFEHHDAVRDLMVVIIANQNGSPDGSYTHGGDISHEGMRLDFDLVFKNGKYQVVRK